MRSSSGSIKETKAEKPREAHARTRPDGIRPLYSQNGHKEPGQEDAQTQGRKDLDAKRARRSTSELLTKVLTI
jgi:hypothetical protein